MRSMGFFLFYGSTYTYLTVMRIEKLAETAGVAIRWRPFNQDVKKKRVHTSVATSISM